MTLRYRTFIFVRSRPRATIDDVASALGVDRLLVQSCLTGLVRTGKLERLAPGLFRALPGAVQPEDGRGGDQRSRRNLALGPESAKRARMPRDERESYGHGGCALQEVWR